MTHLENSQRKASLVFMLAALMAAAWGDAVVAQPASAVRDTVDGTVELRGLTQEQEDAWAREKGDLVRRFRQAQSRIGWLEDRCDVQGRRVGAVEARVGELDRRLREADRLEGSLQDTLQVIMERLAASVGESLPFLPQERDFRLRQSRGRPSSRELRTPGSRSRLRPCRPPRIGALHRARHAPSRGHRKHARPR